MNQTKVFGIGFHKTGTSSLGLALHQLGYKVKNFSPELLDSINQGDSKKLVETIDNYDAFQDNPWPILFEQLDELIPGSKFILTFRQTDRWIKSVSKHFGGSGTEMRQFIYGVGDPIGNENTYIERYEKHNALVRQYFKGRPDDLFEIDIDSENDMKQLCLFLDLPVQTGPYPHVNAAEQRNFLGRIKHRLRTKK